MPAGGPSDTLSFLFSLSSSESDASSPSHSRSLSLSISLQDIRDGITPCLVWSSSSGIDVGGGGPLLENFLILRRKACSRSSHVSSSEDDESSLLSLSSVSLVGTSAKPGRISSEIDSDWGRY